MTIEQQRSLKMVAITASLSLALGCGASEDRTLSGSQSEPGTATSALSIANGMAANGLGANGISLNGITLNGISLNGISLNGISLNGITLNGITLNGISLNGISLNGISLNGISLNGISLNGISLNGISLNGISLNGISLNGISLNGATADDFKSTLGHLVACALPPGQCVSATDLDGSGLTYCGAEAHDPGWADGAPNLNKSDVVAECVMDRAAAAGDEVVHQSENEARFIEVMDYLVSCALPAGDTLTAYDLTGAPVTFAGALGLAPEWATDSLSKKGQEIITACMLGRSNHFGVRVNISMRADGISDVSEDEKNRFSVYEGTFYGNLFKNKPKVYACYLDSPPDFDVSYPHHDLDHGDRLLRRCADPQPGNSSHTLCGFKFTGKCSDVCDTQNGNSLTDCYKNDNKSGKKYKDTLSIWLVPYDDPYASLSDHYDAIYGVQ